MEEIFGLKKKHFDIPIEHLDYGYVGSCSNKDELYAILQELKSGKEGRYEQLEEFTEKRLVEVMSPEEKKRYLALTSNPSAKDIEEAENDLSSFLDSIKSTEEKLQKSHANISKPPPRNHEDEFKTESNPKTDSDSKRAQMLKELGMTDYESIPDAQKKIYAVKEKEKGNEHFRVKDFEKAIHYYSRSILFDPTNPAVFSNRSQAYLYIKNYEGAEEDASKTIELDKNFVKGWYRRGKARFNRGYYKDAISDYQKAYELDPGLKDITKLIEEATNKMNEVGGRSIEEDQKVKEKQKMKKENDDDEEEEVKEEEVNKESEKTKEESTEKPKYKRIQIQEDSGSEDEDDENEESAQQKEKEEEEENNRKKAEEEEKDKEKKREERIKELSSKIDVLISNKNDKELLNVLHELIPLEVEQKHYKECISHCNLYLQHEQSASIYLYRSQCYGFTGNFNEAIGDCTIGNVFVKNDVEKAALLYQKSLMEESINKIEESKKSMENALKLNPSLKNQEKPKQTIATTTTTKSSNNNNIPPSPSIIEDKSSSSIPSPSPSPIETTTDSNSGNNNKSEMTEDATKYKEDGNNYYKQKKYLEAIECYSKGIEICNTNPDLYRNRAACYLALSKYEETIRDCDKAIEYSNESDKNITKAYHRRGIAKKQLKRYKEAIKDFENVLSFDEKNQDSMSELINTRNLYERELRKNEEAKKLSEISQNIMNKIKVPDTPPKTIYEFRKNFVSFKNKPEVFGNYLLIIPPSSFITLFKSGIETDLLTGILKGMTAIIKTNSDWCIETLECLSKCNKFNTATMMLDKEGHKIVTEIFNEVREKFTDKALCEKLEKMYS